MVHPAEKVANVLIAIALIAGIVMLASQVIV